MDLEKLLHGGEMDGTLAALLAVLLIALVAVVGAVLKGVDNIFGARVVAPIDQLEAAVTRLANGALGKKFDYPRHDEIGRVYDVLESMRVRLQGYVQDIDANLGSMADGDFVTERAAEYQGDFRPIRDNIQRIRAAMKEAFQSVEKMADEVAVSAGEAGRGFAVVADEVRKLAEESSQSSQEIGTLIGKAIDAIEEGTAVVREASETIAGITQHADHAAELVTRIGDESRDAREKMKEVRRLGSAILAVVTDNSAISEECAASSSQLSSYSDALKENVGRFRTQ
ncbi:HAMP domain-containing methyl-accepting chemotaxis protein [Selenomonas sp.]|uniref:methyl-accepting chemotaxis protein n=1 Tax=Selenomonas sp. TaxID=2053611 RepID=UPI0025FD1EBA|nr:HAMP domain-containing methyl-accepting chemotaxis protein [Selenomonas sp.]MCI6284243.1 methyl-accepting chemotaxis protein [Selenomonas sp.]